MLNSFSLDEVMRQALINMAPNFMSHDQSGSTVLRDIIDQFQNAYNRQEMLRDWQELSKFLNQKHIAVHKLRGHDVQKKVDIDTFVIELIAVSDAAERSIFNSLWSKGEKSFSMLNEDGRTDHAVEALTEEMREKLSDPRMQFEWVIKTAISDWINFGNALVIALPDELVGVQFRPPHPIDTSVAYEHRHSTYIGRIMVSYGGEDIRDYNRFDSHTQHRVFVRDGSHWRSFEIDEELCPKIVSADAMPRKNVFFLRNIVQRSSPYGLGWGHQALHFIKDLNFMRANNISAIEKRADPPMAMINAQAVAEAGQQNTIDLSPRAINTIKTAAAMPANSSPIQPIFIPEVGQDAAMWETRLLQALGENYRLSSLDMRLEDKTMSAQEAATRTSASTQLNRDIANQFYRELITPMLYNVAMATEKGQEIVGTDMVEDKLKVRYDTIARSLLESEDAQRMAYALQLAAPFLQLDPSAALLFKPEDSIRKIWNDVGLPSKLLNSKAEVEAARMRLAQQQQEQQQRQEEMQQQEQAG
jgi:hypothetical protein